MGVHHARGELDQLARVADQQNVRETAKRRVVERLPDVVRAFDRTLQIQSQRIARKICAVVAGTQKRDALPGSIQAVQFQPDGIYKRLFAHRFDHTACTENGDAAHHAQMLVIGLFGKLRPVFCRNNDRKAARIACLPCDALQSRRDLRARPRVDCRLSDRYRQTRFGHAPNTRAARNRNAAFRAAHRRRDTHTVRHVRIVARVLAYRASSCAVLPARLLDRQMESQSGGRVQRNLGRRRAGQQQYRRRLRSRCRARACCPAAAQRLTALYGQIVHAHAPFRFIL